MFGSSGCCYDRYGRGVDLYIEDGEIRPGSAELLFEGDYLFGPIGRNYDVSGDGQRFLVGEKIQQDADRILWIFSHFGLPSSAVTSFS